MTSTPAPSRRSPASLGLWFVLAVLAGVAGYGLLHETRKSSAPSVSEPAVTMGHGTDQPHASIHGMGHVERPAMSADEERFAQGLWQIHDGVRTAALKMTFAGLAYKMGDSDKAGIKDKVGPLGKIFGDAQTKAEALVVPESMQYLHRDYLAALRLYQTAAAEMIKSLKDDQHLIDAHTHSEQASSLLLKVGDVLWPGEHKPN